MFLDFDLSFVQIQLLTSCISFNISFLIEILLSFSFTFLMKIVVIKITPLLHN